MARLEDLIDTVKDAQLRDALRGEVKELKDHIDFGLVYERHLPETLCLGVNGGLRVADQVRLRKDLESDATLRVKRIRGAKVTISDEAGKATTVPVADLVVVRRFGEPIFPALTSLGKVERSKERPHHAVINGENYHALQLLVHTCEGQVDCIYIDPPYNSGARDWKYNNNYIDGSDTWRHSKWLSFMEKRLRLAKRLLKPDGVLIVTIDEHEQRHLAMLLDDVFRAYQRTMVTIVNAPQGNDKVNFSRVEEYAYFCVPPSDGDLIEGSSIDLKPEPDELDFDPDSEDDADEEDEPDDDHYLAKDDEVEGFVSENARRRGNQSLRRDRVKMFFPIYIDEEAREVVRAGPPIPLDEAPSFEPVDGFRPIWPIDGNGDHRRWRWGHVRMQQLIEQGEIRLGSHNEKRDTWAINRVQPRKLERKKLKTVWRHTSHNAGSHGSGLLARFLGQGQAFSFPKSVYATRDCLAAVVRSRPDALIVDFFAGSGTTLHSTLLMNEADGGNRRCILVTNNEVEERVAGQLKKKGVRPGDPEWEKHGIFELACRPRCEAAITGKRPDRKAVIGKYLDGRPFANGFEENCEFFRLDYLDPDKVELGRSFDALHPLFWLRAGARSARPKRLRRTAGFAVVEDAGYAVLFNEAAVPELIVALNADSVDHVFLHTDSDDAYAEMCELLGHGMVTERVYGDYLDEFRRGVHLAP